MAAPPTIAIIRYSMPMADVERGRADEAAEMGVEPAGQRGEQSRDDEGGQPGAKGVDAEALDQDVAAAQRPHRAADARIEQIGGQPAATARRRPRSDR